LTTRAPGHLEIVARLHVVERHAVELPQRREHAVRAGMLMPSANVSVVKRSFVSPT
jgi:hypothetical protein